MANPFEKRASEYLGDDAAFLAIVTPEPVHTFLKKYASEGRLYDRLVTIVGTPGSGKTTLARLFQYTTLDALVRHKTQPAYKPLLAALASCGAISKSLPRYVGYRLPLESEYREIWELPYSDALKFGLLTTLLQARSVLGWVRALTRREKSEIQIIPHGAATAAAKAIGGLELQGVVERAKLVEESIYRITAALLPPSEDALPSDAISAYRPYDVIEGFRIKDGPLVLPQVIFDDAHTLHPEQLSLFRGWLAKRELRLARWVLMRFDALSTEDALECHLSAEAPASESIVNPSREITVIRLQHLEDRKVQRKEFRKMASDMANRYLAQMPSFSRRNLGSLRDLLATEPQGLKSSDLAELRSFVDSVQQRRGVGDEQRSRIRNAVENYLKTSKSRYVVTVKEAGTALTPREIVHREKAYLCGTLETPWGCPGRK